MARRAGDWKAEISVRRVTILSFVFGYFCLVPLRFARTAPSVAAFDLEGVAVFQCQCTAHACPCQKNGPPTHGTCEAADFVHIRTGHYGDIQLDGLSAVTVGNLVDQNRNRLYATIYIDRKASPQQREALTSIEQFINGGYETAPLKAAPVKVVLITFSESPEKTTYGIAVPEILEEQIFLHRDASGRPLSTETAMDSWANVKHYADNREFRYHDAEAHRTWDHSGGYANVKYFRLTKQMYDNRELLGQYGDFSGHWTREQLDLIHKQELEK